MTIQRLNLGTAPTGVGGDTERSAFKKIDDNFGDVGNACSRLVGKSNGNIMVVGDAYGWGNGFDINEVAVSSITDFTSLKNNIEVTRVWRCDDVGYLNSGLGYQYGSNLAVTTGDTHLNISVSHNGQGVKFLGWSNQSSTTSVYNMYHDKSSIIYATTTASSPNVFVTSTGELQRSTSSERYKKDIQHIELGDKEYAAIRQVKPIAYKSTTDVDNPNWTFQSFSAEELAKASPTLVLWEYEETVIDEGTGLQVVRKLPERRPAGLNLNGIVALQHAVSLKQADLIDAQAKQIKDLTARVAKLEKVVSA